MKHDQKKEAIIMAAEKRFAHFTVAKTTMAEIARDLGISKALLYYYFPDKLMLYGAVIQNIIERILRETNDKLYSSKDPVENLLAYIRLRKEFVILYYNIFSYAQTAIEKSNENVACIFDTAYQAERKIITQIFSQGINQKKLHIDDLERTTDLFLNCLEGLRHMFLIKQGIIFPEREQFEEISTYEKQLTTIFIKGISI